MRKFFLSAALLLLVLPAAKCATLRTAAGEMYYDIKLKEVSFRGLVFLHREGVATLKPDEFIELDKRRFKDEIEKYNLCVAAEKKRVAEEKKRIAEEKKRLALEARKKQQALQKRYNADIAALKKKAVNLRYLEGNRLLRKYNKQRLNFKELRNLIAASKKQLLTNPVIRKKQDLRIARIYCLSIMALNCQFSMVAEPKSPKIKTWTALLKRCQSTVFSNFNALSLDEKLVVVWKINSDANAFKAALKKLPAKTKEEKAVVAKLNRGFDSTLNGMTKYMASLGINARDIKSMNFSKKPNINAIYLKLAPANFCKECKAQGILVDNKPNVEYKKCTVSAEKCGKCGGLGVTMK